MTGDTPLVQLEQVACAYDETVVLENIDLVIRPGEVVALLGGSGSGKSTLLRAMTGLLAPRAGMVRLFGEPLYQLEAAERDALLRRTGMLFQQDALFGSLSIIDNVALPLRELTPLPPPVVRETARLKLALVGLSGLEDRGPAELSGGQRKRAALARASVLDPEIIFCDEPTAGLDPVVAAGIDEALGRFRTVLGITLVVITHSIESVRAIADRAVMVGRGTIMATGTVEELARSRDPDVYEFFHRVAGDRASLVGSAPGAAPAATASPADGGRPGE